MSSPDGEETIIRCGTTKGDITLQLIREWSPNGYDRAVELFERHFYDHSHLFRAVPNFLVQFGISYSDDKELKSFARKPIQDDPKFDPPIEFHPGMISYAGSGPNSRTSQLFISLGGKNFGRELWETPIGKVIEGMENAEQFYSYGDMPPWGKGPVQGKIHSGPQYIEENFPLIDKFLECTVERSESGSGDADVGENIGAKRPNSDDENANAKSNLNQKTEVPSSRADDGDDDHDNFLVPESKRKLIRMGNQNDDVSYRSLAIPCVLVSLLLLLLVSIRGRNKVSAKMN